MEMWSIGVEVCFLATILVEIIYKESKLSVHCRSKVKDFIYVFKETKSAFWSKGINHLQMIFK